MISEVSKAEVGSWDARVGRARWWVVGGVLEVAAGHGSRAACWVSTSWVHFTYGKKRPLGHGLGAAQRHGKFGAAAGHGGGEVHGVGPGLRAEVTIGVVRELGAAAEAAAGVGHEDGEQRVVAVEPAPRAGGVFALVVEQGNLVRGRVPAQAGQVGVHE